MAEVRQNLERLPGVTVEVGQPISHRIDHLLSGTRAQIAIKLFGADLATLRSKGKEIEGVMSGNLPWDLVLSGGGLSIGAMLCGVSGLAFAIGVYLPLATMAPLFVGGCVRALCDRKQQGAEAKSDPGVLAASGLVAGEGLAGVFVAALVGKGLVGKASAEKLILGGHAGEWAVVATILALCGFLYYAGKRR